MFNTSTIAMQNPNGKTTQSTVILGLGETGLSCCRYLRRRQIEFMVMDSRFDPPAAGRFMSEFADVPCVLGKLDEAILAGARHLIVSPGIDIRLPAIRDAEQRGALITRDIELFLEAARKPIVTITGSNGKSTVAAMLAEMITEAGRTVQLGGNFGPPALDLLVRPEPDFFVLELSSFQLETLSKNEAVAAVVLNISEDHMDRYDSFDDYLNAKRKIYEGCRMRVVNLDEPWIHAMGDSAGPSIRFSTECSADAEVRLQDEKGIVYLAAHNHRLMPVSDLKLRGRHNVENALAAVALGLAIDLPMPAMTEVLRRFRGLPHRCQFVTEFQGVTFINDSKGTNVGATCAAIKGISEGNDLILIAGGDSKGAALMPLANDARERVRMAVLFGKDATALGDVLQSVTRVHYAVNMRAAVQFAMQQACSGDTVLLSPACASQDMFHNYQHRGDQFVACVRELITGGSDDDQI